MSHAHADCRRAQSSRRGEGGGGKGRGCWRLRLQMRSLSEGEAQGLAKEAGIEGHGHGMPQRPRQGSGKKGGPWGDSIQGSGCRRPGPRWGGRADDESPRASLNFPRNQNALGGFSLRGKLRALLASAKGPCLSALSRLREATTNVHFGRARAPWTMGPNAPALAMPRTCPEMTLTQAQREVPWRCILSWGRNLQSTVVPAWVLPSHPERTLDLILTSRASVISSAVIYRKKKNSREKLNFTRYSIPVVRAWFRSPSRKCDGDATHPPECRAGGSSRVAFSDAARWPSWAAGIAFQTAGGFTSDGASILLLTWATSSPLRGVGTQIHHHSEYKNTL